jgi:beta-aspartyl-peptidase (threonine type)
MERTSSYQLICHGGVGSHVPPDVKEKLQQVIEDIANVGQQMLAQGDSALDTVEMVVRLFESNKFFNAGIPGSSRTEEGLVELDAGIMDGKTAKYGGITNSKQEHPISIARALMNSAFSYRTACSLPQDMRSLLLLMKKYDIWRHLDTVGAVARDRYGNLAVAASTGGINGKPRGRVSDSSVVGAGFFADNRTCAVCCSGVGEEALRRAACAQLHFRLLIPREMKGAPRSKKQAEKQLKHALHTVVQTFPPHTIGFIAIDSFGNIALEYNTDTFIVTNRQS